jgi:N-acetylmuramoyl-L-alanine amidase
MAKAPFAVWKPFAGSPGPYVGGHSFKIVHHTAEGSSADGAFATYQQTKNIPHFTVDDMTIYQHIDTDEAASALKHPAGTAETNRSSAVQIELIGFAGKPKNPASLKNMARICRWIEATHGVPQVWPSGHPKPPVNGQDPGGHNRNEENWNTKGGHYGHCHVPNNVHWDPAYTEAEVAKVMKLAAPADIAPPSAGTMADHGTEGHHS